MKPMQGFQGFPSYTNDAKMEADPAPSGPKVFDQLMQQLQSLQDNKKAATSNQADMLWPMGTIMKGKKI